jgi:dynein heavy chain
LIKGVTHIDNLGNGTFTPLARWVKEHELYHKLLKIPFFFRYRIWKCFKSWKNTVLHTKVQNSKLNLSQNLFFCENVLRIALVQINQLNVDMMFNFKILKLEADKTLELSEFSQLQTSSTIQIYENVLVPWCQKLREIVESACKQRLKDAGFPVLDDGENVPKLSFTAQAARRTECRKLARFVKLVDYMMVSSLQSLVISSVQELLKYCFKGCKDSDVTIDNSGSGNIIILENSSNLKILSSEFDPLALEKEGSSATTVQVGGIVVGDEVGTSVVCSSGYYLFTDILCRLVGKKVPKLELKEVIEDEGPIMKDFSEALNLRPIEPLSKKMDETTKPKASERVSFVPSFRTEILMNSDTQIPQIEFSAGVTDYLGVIDNGFKLFLSIVERVSLLTNSIEFLDASSSQSGVYSAVRDLDEPEFGIGPQVNVIVLESAYFKELCGRIRGVFVGMYQNISSWASSLEPMRQMWLENANFDVLANLSQAVGIETFRIATYEAGEGENSALIPGSTKVRSILLNDPRLQDEKFCILEYGVTVSRNEDGDPHSTLCAFFAEMLNTFSLQKESMAKIPIRSVINNILIDSTKLKSVLLPSPERCFNDVAKLLPGLARDKNELLLTEIQAWVRILKTHPTNVEGFVDYLEWLENSIEQLTQSDEK